MAQPTDLRIMSHFSRLDQMASHSCGSFRALRNGHPPFESAYPMQIYAKVTKGISKAHGRNSPSRKVQCWGPRPSTFTPSAANMPKRTHLGARTLLRAPGIATSNKKLLGAPGLTTRSDRTLLVLNARWFARSTAHVRFHTVEL